MTQNLLTNEVIKELRNYADRRKVCGVLSSIRQTVSEAPETCFCIEGVFCEVASKLGYQGEFVTEERQLPIHFALGEASNYERLNPGRHFLRNGRQKFRSRAPNDIFPYLGLPTVVPLSELERKGLKALLYKHIWGAIRHTEKGDGFTWHALNDASDLSLKELTQLACDLLEKK